MVGRRAALATQVLLVLAVLVPAPGSAQEAPVYLPLGVDATGDASINVEGEDVPMLDTWIDINGLGVALVGTDLVFHLGLEGTTTEAGSYCWMVAFESGGDEYVGLDCYEGLAYENTNAASGVIPLSTSRGTNVASSVAFDETGAVITIPLDAIGAKVGDTIEDVYGLTYATRALVAVDTVPDAKRGDADAEESLGAYVIGGGLPGEDGNGTLSQRFFLDLTDDRLFLHEFTNATSDVYTFNLALPWANATLLRTAAVANGTANVTLLQGNETVLSVVLSNETDPAGDAAGNATGNATAGNATAGNSTAAAATNATRLDGNATGNWTLVVRYDGFVGTLGFEFQKWAPAPVGGLDPTSDGSKQAAVDEAEEAPGLGAAFVLVALLGVASVAARRRRD